jgi:hypothetical protein
MGLSWATISPATAAASMDRARAQDRWLDESGRVRRSVEGYGPDGHISPLAWCPRCRRVRRPWSICGWPLEIGLSSFVFSLSNIWFTPAVFACLVTVPLHVSCHTSHNNVMRERLFLCVFSCKVAICRFFFLKNGGCRILKSVHIELQRFILLISIVFSLRSSGSPFYCPCFGISSVSCLPCFHSSVAFLLPPATLHRFLANWGCVNIDLFGFPTNISINQSLRSPSKLDNQQTLPWSIFYHFN